MFLSARGRIPRSTFWYAMMGAWVSFIVLFMAVDALLGRTSTLLLYPPFYWALFALAAKRYHDLGKRAWWLLLAFLPLAGPAWLAISLGLRRGTRGENRFGPETRRPSVPIEVAA